MTGMEATSTKDSGLSGGPQRARAASAAATTTSVATPTTTAAYPSPSSRACHCRGTTMLDKINPPSALYPAMVFTLWHPTPRGPRRGALVPRRYTRARRPETGARAEPGPRR